MTREGWALAEADLKPNLALPVRVSVVGVERVDAPGRTILGFVVTVVGHAEPNPVERLIERHHHGDDHVFVVMVFDPREIQIGREAPPLPMNIPRGQVPPLKANLLGMPRSAIRRSR